MYPAWHALGPQHRSYLIKSSYNTNEIPFSRSSEIQSHSTSKSSIPHQASIGDLGLPLSAQARSSFSALSKRLLSITPWYTQQRVLRLSGNKSVSGSCISIAGCDPGDLGTFATGSIGLGATCHPAIVLFDGDTLDDPELVDSRDSLVHQLRNLA